VGAEVVLSPKAWEDLESLLEYLEARSPATAERYAREIPERLAQLETFPESGRFVPELLREDSRRWRELLFEHLRILYRVDGSRVTVVRMVDDRRLLTVEVPF
jgi:toxin ParE1/3/4